MEYVLRRFPHVLADQFRADAIRTVTNHVNKAYGAIMKVGRSLSFAVLLASLSGRALLSYFSKDVQGTSLVSVDEENRAELLTKQL